jgi:hypothetical protein
MHTRRRMRLLFLLAFTCSLAACGGSVASTASAPEAANPDAGGGVSAPSGAACKKSEDCNAGSCIFLVRDACGASGVCYAPAAPTAPYNCVAVPLVEACGCDGNTVQVAQSPVSPECGPYPDGYAPAPVAHFGPCVDASPGPQPAPPSASCQTDTDCGSGKRCGFPESAGCGAVGSCFPTATAMCQAMQPGCACDGTFINLICEGFPSGYASKPLLHAGPCESVDAGSGG